MLIIEPAAIAITALSVFNNSFIAYNKFPLA